MCRLCDQTPGIENLNDYKVHMSNPSGDKTTDFKGTSAFHAAVCSGAMMVTNFVINMFPGSLTSDELDLLFDFVAVLKGVDVTVDVTAS